MTAGVNAPVVPPLAPSGRTAAGSSGGGGAVRQPLPLSSLNIPAHELVRARLGEHIDDRVVLHACHPLLTARAIAADPQAVWLSGVVVRADDSGAVIEAGDPTVLAQAGAGSALSEIAADLRHLLVDALDLVCSGRVG